MNKETGFTTINQIKEQLNRQFNAFVEGGFSGLGHEVMNQNNESIDNGLGETIEQNEKNIAKKIQDLRRGFELKFTGGQLGSENNIQPFARKSAVTKK
jgi:hypothetical protein